MAGTLLITRPEHDKVTHYLSKWSEPIINRANAKKVAVIDLHREKACRDRVIGTLKKNRPRLVVFNGHGSDNTVHGHDNEIILNDSDGEAVKGKIIYARSCKSAKNLGEYCVRHGADAYLGYKEDFVMFSEPLNVHKPLEDTTAGLFLEPSNHIPLSLLKGHTAGEANNKSRNIFRRNIQRLMIEGPSCGDYYTLGYLAWDMTHQVCLGDEDAKF